ncbi:YaaA family protein [Nesterenkonia ebinurensis]|uniref:YaaA family protein n=1 Tax=Nesterenkonia ebinurensis TaxID=2608252 RepID=UPI00168BB719|nr:peroxide stress protein YaaA [Nesterenkonia ebinurensis]
MLILLPPSEGKTAPENDEAPPLNLAQLTLPGLANARRQVLQALVEASGRQDAQQVLKVGAKVLAEVAANRQLGHAAAAPAWQIYTGVLYESLGTASLSAEQLERAAEHVLIFSGLFGVTGFTDRIPAYRCAMDVKLPPLGNLGTFWKNQLAQPLGELAEDRLLVDCRSGSYQKPFPGDRSRRLQVNSFTEQNGQRKVVTHFAKAARGELTGMLLQAGTAPESIDEVAHIASRRWRVEVRPAGGRDPHQLDLIS